MGKLGLQTLLQAGLLGAIAGIRSMSAPALVSEVVADRSSAPLDGTPLSFFSEPAFRKTIRWFALGEMMVDKVPFIPPRNSGALLLARCLSGGMTGAVVGLVNRRLVLPAALIGVAAALVSANAAYRWRKQAAENTPVPGPLLGTVEDMVVLGTGYLLRRTI